MMMDRRAVLLGAAACGASQLFPATTWAALPERRLLFRNAHNGEKVDVCYYSGGRLRASGIAELNHFLRDWRTGEVTRMDTDLFDTLVQLHAATGADKRAYFTLISGYRSPKTNARLHLGSHGVASKSQHMRGKAVDIQLRNVRLASLQKAALSLKAGGVGYYPDDGFVHVDTGPVRRWNGN
ncbi:DUF882 domain-containing protein [Sphingobium limneticum]|uniref:Murein endopeptidase K n=1 Tax=Sphingobium limneticum TaxID=1007511 RepID=A0A5J5I5S8_9SPHN|nr:DUF882 domain-containing protein [Sphingobium limneticum]KAA9018134.1 DUF882 domain-containing protein [Sphingobium limneticum]KAA9030770.1 DUF882 domain-containing protein [Sphingobium limneticum]